MKFISIVAVELLPDKTVYVNDTESYFAGYNSLRQESYVYQLIQWRTQKADGVFSLVVQKSYRTVQVGLDFRISQFDACQEVVNSVKQVCMTGLQREGERGQLDAHKT